jgi:hypothetical protein
LYFWVFKLAGDTRPLQDGDLCVSRESSWNYP